MNKSLLYIIILISVIVDLDAQPWSINHQDSTTSNFYSVQNNFNLYWAKFDTIPRGKGYNQFKRWEWYWEQRVFPTGLIKDITYNISGRESKSKNDRQYASTWKSLGPSTSVGGYAGLGRVNVAKSPSNENIIYAGAASGGLWKSADNGQTWSTNTDEFSSLGISDLLIQPNNANILYLATGDDDASSTYSVGVLKSTNGGQTWNTTGLSFQTSQLKRIYKLIMHPSNFNIIYAVGTNGVDKTTNGGSTWSNILNGSFYDIKLKPQDPNTVYVVGNGFYASTDAGTSWEQYTTGWPSSNVTRVAIDVTPAAPDNVYAIMSNSEYGFGGFFMSTNSGYTWQNRSNTPNILGWSPTGTDAGGQGWYDLCIAVSPIDGNNVYVGGINIWHSENAGSTWTLESSWYPVNNAALIHADHHDLWFLSGSTTLYSSNDGGIYRKRLNGNWEWLGSGLKITQFYRLGCSSTDSSLIIAGSQDNGTKLKYSAGFRDLKGGDGMECIIDYQDNNIMYATLPFGALFRSDDGGDGFVSIKPSTAHGNWVTPFIINPKNHDIIYAGYEDVYKSTNRGNNWFKISNLGLPSNKALDFISISETDTNVIYIGQGDGIFKKTTNGGANWENITKPVNLWITSLAVHPTNPRRFAISFSGYNPSQRIYQSSDGGNSWQNVTGSLPAIPVNTVLYEKNTPNRIYAGTDIGVYYRDDFQSNWIEYSDGLPNVVVTELEINYPSKMLRAVTYGRGLWQVPLAETILKTDFSGDTVVCTNSSAKYIARSFNGVNNSWYATGGSINGSSTGDTVIVNWTTPGTGSLKLIQELSGKKDSLNRNIAIINPPSSVITGNDSVCYNSENIYTSDALTPQKRWTVTGGTLIGNDTSASIKVQWTNSSSGTVKLVTKYPNSNCADSSIKNINILRIVFPQINGLQTVCPLNKNTYYITNNPLYKTKWSVEGGYIYSSVSDTVHIIWDTTGTGKLILELTDINTGCFDTVHYNIIKYDVPDAILSGNQNTCINTVEEYQSSAGDYNFKWTTQDDRIIGDDTLNKVLILWKNTGNRNLHLQKTDRVTGCSIDTLYLINVNPLPAVTITGNEDACLNNEQQYSISKFSGLNIKWIIKGGIIIGTTSDSLVTVRWNAAGQGAISAIAESNQTGCTDTALKQVFIYSLPDVDFSGLTTVAPNSTEKYIVKQKGMITNWEVTGGIISGNQTEDSVTIVWNSSGPASIKLTQTNPLNLCSDSITENVIITTNSKPFITGDTIICTGTINRYTTSASPKFTNNWFVKNGEIIGSDKNYFVEVKWIQYGAGEVKLIQINNDTQVTDSSELMIKINDIPPKPYITRNNDVLISSSDTSNRWFLNKIQIAGAGSKYYQPDRDGTYNTTAIENGCESVMSDDYFFSFSSVKQDDYCSINVSQVSGVRILSLSYDKQCGIFKSVRIYNSIGENCDYKILNISDNGINLGVTCSSGLYFILVIFDQSEKTIPIIIAE